MKRLAPFALLLLASLVASDAGADARAAEGRFFYQRGAQEYARRHYAAAVDHFLTAYRATPNPRVLFNLAMAANRAHERELAFTSFVEYLASDDEDEARRALAVRHRDELQGQLALVRVVTDPPGATLYVERRERGIAARSPALLPLGASGEVLVMAEHEGYRRAEGRVAVVVGQTAELTISLAARTGRLEIAVEPSEAQLSVTPEGESDPIPVEGAAELPTGWYLVRGSAPGYRPGSARVRVQEGSAARATLELTALPRPTGRLLVDSATPGARVEVDGRVVGTTPVGVSVTIGEHDVVVERDGYRERLEVTAERPTYVNVSSAVP